MGLRERGTDRTLNYTGRGVGRWGETGQEGMLGGLDQNIICPYEFLKPLKENSLKEVCWL